MGRLEAFALGNKVWPSTLDALGNSIGYAMVLVVVSFLKNYLGLVNFLEWKYLVTQQKELDYMLGIHGQWSYVITPSS